MTGRPVYGGLAVLRGRAGVIFSGEAGLFFGQNLVHRDLGVISVGDQVAVPKMNDKPNVDFPVRVFSERIAAEAV